MANNGIEHTFSNEESVGYPPPPPPYPYNGDDEEAVPNDAPNETKDLELNANEEELEHTLSELDFSVQSYKEYDSVAESTVESEEERIVEEKRNPLAKKRNLLGLLALALLVIVASLGAATRSKNNSANNDRGNLAISKVESGENVASTEIPLEISAETSSDNTADNTAEDQTKESLEDQVKDSLEDVVIESAEDEDELQESAETPSPEVDSDPADDSNQPACSTIFDLACTTDGLETLCALIAEACYTPGLEAVCNTIGEVGDSGPYTVFAPNNSAFDTLPMVVKNAIQNPIVLNNILFYHVIDGDVLASDLVCDSTVTMANMDVTMTLCSQDGHFFQTGSGNFEVFPKIVTTDVNACNGVIHVVDQVFLPAPNAARPPAWLNPNGFPIPQLNDNSSEQNPDGELDTSEQLFGSDEMENVVSNPDDTTVGDENQDVSSCQDEISVSKDCFTFGETVEVNYKFCSPSSNTWLGVFRPRFADPSGLMHQPAAYWEYLCGGHNATCAEPVESGVFTLNINVPPGRYQVHSIGNTDPPYFSNSATLPFVIEYQCEGSLPLSEEPMTSSGPGNPHGPDHSNGSLPSHR